MPYVDRETRDYLDPKVEELLGSLHRSGSLAYVVYRLLVVQFTCQPRFETIARMCGELWSAWSEFNHRVVMPYEHDKRLLNGDIEKE